MDRILIVNVNWVGDVLFSTPAIHALRVRYPSAHIACLVPPRCKPVLKNNPDLNEVITFDESARPWAPSGFWAVVQKVRRGRFDTAVFFHSSRTKILLCVLAGVKRRIGFKRGSKTAWLTQVLEAPAASVHRTDIFLRLARELGASAADRRPVFLPEPGSERSAAELLNAEGIGKRPYVVVHAGGNWDLKRWPADSFVQWIRSFQKEYPWGVVLCGTAPEVKLTEAIRVRVNDASVVSLAGRTSLDELACILKGARMLLSNDSGPIHLAASQDTPILGLFGPTHESVTGPIAQRVRILRRDVGCQVPCYFRTCDHRVCMEWIRPDEAMTETRNLIGVSHD